MLPVPTLDDLSDFTGRPADSYGPFAASALRQATLLFSVVTRLTAIPVDADEAQLANFAILEMADRIYLEQPNAQIKAGPFQAETIGSYSYSKSAQLAISAYQNNTKTGLKFWDLAIELLTQPGASNVASWAITVIDRDLTYDTDGNAYVVSPGDLADFDRPEQRIS